MDRAKPGNVGIKKLIKNGKRKFRIAENVSYYSENDYKKAEKKFIKSCVLGGRC